MDGTARDAICANAATTVPVSAIDWFDASTYTALQRTLDGPSIAGGGLKVTRAESVAPGASAVDGFLVWHATDEDSAGSWYAALIVPAFRTVTVWCPVVPETTTT